MDCSELVAAAVAADQRALSELAAGKVAEARDAVSRAIELLIEAGGTTGFFLGPAIGATALDAGVGAGLFIALIAICGACALAARSSTNRTAALLLRC